MSDSVTGGDRTAAARIADLREFHATASLADLDPLLAPAVAVASIPPILDHIEDVLRHHAVRTGTEPLFEVPYCDECGYVYAEDTANSHTADFFDALHLLDILERAMEDRR